MEITIAEATDQICQNLPGLDRMHARKVAEILVPIAQDESEEAAEGFYRTVESGIRSGEEWAVQVAMASVRKVG
jgi:hypothetical protein